VKGTRLRTINVFVKMEKSPWIKSKTKQGPNKKKIDEFYPNRRKNLAESDKDSQFNQISESEAACASSVDVSTVSKRKNSGSEESRRYQCYERAISKDEPGLFFICPKKNHRCSYFH